MTPLRIFISSVQTESARAPRTYEIPEEVVTEAIVNAVAHRDYTDNGSVQVMLFADRLEVWNPGRLPPPLTLEKLRVAHTSVPGNPLLAESMYLAEYIERMGTGTLDMIRRCLKAGLPEPKFAVPQGFVTTVWRASSDGQVGGQARPPAMVHQAADSATTPKATQETTQETTQERILALLEAEPELTQRMLAERVGLTPDGVKYHLTKLRAAGAIRHVGSTKAGRWEVLK